MDASSDPALASVHPEAAQQALDAAKGASMSVLADQRPNPAWVWPSIGAAVFVFVASFDVEVLVIRILMTAAYAVAIGAIVSAAARARGVQAKVTELPKDLRMEILRFAGICSLLAMSVLALAVFFDGAPRFTIAGIICGVTVIFLGRHYDRRWLVKATAHSTQNASVGL